LILLVASILLVEKTLYYSRSCNIDPTAKTDYVAHAVERWFVLLYPRSHVRSDEPAVAAILKINTTTLTERAGQEYNIINFIKTISFYC
jgi:hypothetical protein